MEPAKKPNPVVAIIIVIAIIGLLAGAVIVLGKGENTTTSETADTASTAVGTNESQTSPAAVAANYKDGRYEATGSYATPGGRESVGLRVTIVGGLISDIELDQKASGGESEEYQSKFASGYKSLVVGKKVSDVSLSRVAGSSLTSAGFNNALDEIRSQAEI